MRLLKFCVDHCVSLWLWFLACHFLFYFVSYILKSQVLLSTSLSYVMQYACNLLVNWEIWCPVSRNTMQCFQNALRSFLHRQWMAAMKTVGPVDRYLHSSLVRLYFLSVPWCCVTVMFHLLLLPVFPCYISLHSVLFSIVTLWFLCMDYCCFVASIFASFVSL